ncbi:MAG: zinc-ribbon domain-containing protein [Spirochaetales bacterium]|uniref:Zinc-ribbon domain-containing protein n=1 Tax=Candidatus Thalassospirochaeta sargassi TaxID=3119039 RepID=A0AAJ1ICK3_9SPIO|nr:zinc-ribbon domain-containing protein [Spirochaetales bacterium]
MQCPECSGELQGRSSRYTCKNCGAKWKVTFRCEQCGELPKVAASCGAVSFFCDTCNSLKSRESMDKEFVKDTE